MNQIFFLREKRNHDITLSTKEINHYGNKES